MQGAGVFAGRDERRWDRGGGGGGGGGHEATDRERHWQFGGRHDAPGRPILSTAARGPGFRCAVSTFRVAGQTRNNGDSNPEQERAATVGKDAVIIAGGRNPRQTATCVTACAHLIEPRRQE